MVFDAETHFTNIAWCASSNHYPWTRKPGAFLVLFQTPGQSEVKLSIGWWPVCRTKHLASFQAVLSHSISAHFFASSKQTTASKFQRETALMADSGSFLQFMTKAQV